MEHIVVAMLLFLLLFIFLTKFFDLSLSILVISLELFELFLNSEKAGRF